MSQIEHSFQRFLSKNPDVEACYAKGLVNRRSLARYLVTNQVVESNQIEATIAMLRRYEFKTPRPTEDCFSQTKITVKDSITILDFQKEKELVVHLEKLISKFNYDHADTLKIVVGTSSVKVFLDAENGEMISSLTEKFKLLNKFENISEISIFFLPDAIVQRGIFATISRELVINDIAIREILTTSPELLIYLDEEYVLKAYEVIKRLQKN